MMQTYNCPCCDSDNIARLDIPEIFKDEVIIQSMCRECDATFTQIYRYEDTDIIEKGNKMGATYEFEHELGKKVWVMLKNVPTEVIVFGHVLTATLHTYKEGLCEYTVRQDPHANIGELRVKGNAIFNTKSELVGSL